MDARVNAAGDPSKYDKNLVNFAAVTSEFLGPRLHRAGYTLGFAKHF